MRFARELKYLRFWKTTLVFLSLFILFSQQALAEKPSPTGKAALKKVTAVDRFLQQMPLRKKIGQMFMVGFQGTDLNQGLGDTISKVSPGGIIVFGRNIVTARQISHLLADSQKASYKASNLPLLISTDQEGGDVIRIKTAMPLPSELALGKTGDVAVTEMAGQSTGQLLRTLGFNMNLSPVLDVADEGNQLGFIGTRTYGSNPDLVSNMGTSFSKGLLSEGVLPTAKHFPGHGATTEDSHLKTPQRNCSWKELRDKDLPPFKAMQKSFANQWAVMLGNVAYPKIDPSGSAATTSKIIVSELLRGEMGFNGLVITDDIQMGSAGTTRETKERVLRAIEAGADVIVVAWNKKLQKDFVDTIEQAVKAKRISVARVEESLRRIIAAKKLVARKLKPVASDTEIRLALENPKFEKIATATLDARLNRPLDADEQAFKDFADGRDVLVFSANQHFSQSFKNGLKKASRARIFNLDIERPNDVNRVMLANPRAVGVYYVSGYHAAKAAAKISRDVAARMLAVTVESQSALTNADDFHYIAEVYYRHPNLGKMIADHYFGDGGAISVRTPSSAANATKTDAFPAE